MTSSPSASPAADAVPAHDPPGPLTAHGVVRGLLRRHGLDADKGFGQNFLVDDAALRDARIKLILATREVLRNGLNLLGVSAPEQM